MTATPAKRPSRAKTTVADAGSVKVADGFQNLLTNTGTSAGNLAQADDYTLGLPITRNRLKLEAMYRQSWIVGVAVDSIADDMCREGVDFNSEVSADEAQALQGAMIDLDLWQSVADVIRWSRLYGGAIGVIMIDGHDPAEPLRIDRVGPDSFEGILPLNRWELMPLNVTLATGFGSNVIGRPKFYQVGPQATGLANQTVHHSRVIRMEGIRLPLFQRLAEQTWGMSIVERMFDRLTAFDSTTLGTAQLVYRAYLRTIKIEGLRTILAAGGAAEAALMRNVEAIKSFQRNEGITLLDAKDEMEAATYTFTGLDEVLGQFGQQISGAIGVPLVRLFGQSPAGLNSTGESDMRMHYDNIASLQKRMLRSPMNKVLDVLHRSVLRSPPGAKFGYTFNSLWQMSEVEKADYASKVATAVITAYTEEVIDKATALQELKQAGEVSGVFSSIRDEDVRNERLKPPEIEDIRAFLDTPAGLHLGPETDKELAIARVDQAVAALGTQPKDKADDPRLAPFLKRAVNDAWTFNDAAPRSLYVSRKVKNAREIIAWARGQGIKGLLPADELHVTITWSKASVDWFKMGDDCWTPNNGDLIIAPGGPRIVDSLGAKGATVLLFTANALVWRHEDMKRNGASWEFDSYTPHVTLTYEPQGDLDLMEIEPYRGRIVLGPEEFELAKGFVPIAMVVSDAEHWITVHPNGKEHKGQPLLIEGGGREGYTVKGGAGGKLNGRKVSPKSVSKPRGGGSSGAGEPEGRRERGGSKAPSGPHRDPQDYGQAAFNAEHYSDIAHRENTAEAHGRAAEAHETAKAHAQEAHNQAAVNKHYTAASEHASAKADLLSGSAKTAEEHMAAAEAHGEANLLAAASGRNDVLKAHSQKIYEHLSARAQALEKTAKTVEQLLEAAQAHAYAGKRAKERMGGAEGDALSRWHSGEVYKLQRKADLLGKRLKREATRSEFHATEGGQKLKSIDAKFQNHSTDQIAEHFKSKWGMGFHNGSNAKREYKALKAEYKKTYWKLSEPEREELVKRLSDARQAAAATISGPYKTHTEYDLNEKGANSKAARATLGHVDAAMEHLDSLGYDVKGALERAPVTYTPGSTGKSWGHAWQRGQGRGGVFSMSSGKVGADFLIQQKKFSEQRAAAGKARWLACADLNPEDLHRQVVIHELAHAIGMNPAINSPGRLDSLLRQDFPNYLDRAKWIRANLSEYAASNILETDAELAAMVTSPTYKRGTLPKHYEDHVDELFKRRT